MTGYETEIAARRVPMLEAALKERDADNDRLRERVAQLEHEAAERPSAADHGELCEQLAAAQAVIVGQREALKESVQALPKQHPAQTFAEKLLDQTTNLDALHEARAVAVERLKDTPFFSADQKEYIAGIAAAHRARKEGK